MRTSNAPAATAVWRTSLLLGLASAIGPGAGQTLIVDSASAVPSRPGMDLIAHYDLGAGCDGCDPDNIRWIQSVQITDNAGQERPFAGFPSRFMDPLPGQGIGNDYTGNAATGDLLPWYDITRNQPERTGAFQRGAGAFAEDGPGGPAFNEAAPIRVQFHTLVVATDPATRTFASLGGFSWGFYIDPKDESPGLLDVMALNGDDLIGAFNQLIQQGTSLDGQVRFEPWTMVSGDPECQLELLVVPEPPGMAALGLTCLAFGLRWRRSRAASRPDPV